MMTFEARSASAARSEPAPCLRRLSLRDFRNFEELECEFPEAGVAIVGPNGSGKTNLLESVYYLEIFRSFRNAPDRKLVRFEQSVFRIEAELEGTEPDANRTEPVSISAAYDRQGSRKKVVRDRRELERVSEGIGGLGLALFRLEDLAIVREGPGERRRYLDVVLSLGEPGYLGSLQRYRAVLLQRNEALRRGAGAPEIAAWTGGLLDEGARLLDARQRWVEEGAEAFAGYYREISGGTDTAVRYASGVSRHTDGEPAGRAEWRDAFANSLEATAERERRRGMTVVGPHRDDLRFWRLGDDRDRDLRDFGSSGQQRTAALALRLVEADRTHERLGREPIYLLDDVFAELDDDRSRRLLALLEDGRSGQVILTAPKAGDLELRAGSLQRWGIRNGRLLT